MRVCQFLGPAGGGICSTELATGVHATWQLRDGVVAVMAVYDPRSSTPGYRLPDYRLMRTAPGTIQWQLDARPDLDTAHALLPAYSDLWDIIGAAVEGHYLVSWAKSIELHRLHRTGMS
ncbi:hypothetical protein [Nocardia lijiangensis]|uniref:hypothetical protein n=1 Tax=Nocardia lijiangensis TaxID=299618 RepID=UPI003D729754